MAGTVEPGGAVYAWKAGSGKAQTCIELIWILTRFKIVQMFVGAGGLAWYGVIHREDEE